MEIKTEMAPVREVRADVATGTGMHRTDHMRAPEHPADILDRFVKQEVEKMIAHHQSDGNGLAVLGMAPARPV